MTSLWRLVLLLALGLQCLVNASSVQAESRGARLENPKPAAGKTQASDKPLAEFIAAQTGKSWAVVIGINEYQDSTIRRLKYAVADARAMAQELERRGYHVILLLNEQATARAINTELRSKLRQRVGKTDRVVIYYAGHGVDDKVEGTRTMGYLLPVDGERENVPGTGISMGVVKEMADALPAKHVLFLIDACYGGVAGQQLRSLPKISEAYVRQITRERGRQLITAGGADQEALEASDGGHGLFTTYLLKGLAEGLADTNQDGVIPASELYAYVESRVFREAHLQRHEQRPEFWTLSAEKGEFVFLASLSGESPVGKATASSTPLSPVQQELAVLQEQERQIEEQLRQAELQRQVEAKRQQLEEKKRTLELAKAYSLPQQTSRTIVGKDGAPMVLIPAGSFLMGSTKEEVDQLIRDCIKERGKDQQTCKSWYQPELPQHRVQLSAFYLDTYEVTNRLFRQFTQQTGYQTTAEREGSAWAFVEGKGWEEVKGAHWQKPEAGATVFDSNRAEHPVVSVSWDDAQAYCRWAEKRLPTEAEFEYALRAGTTTRYWWGDGNPGVRRVENIADEAAKNLLKTIMLRYNDGAVRTAPVGSYEANPWGLYDISGNAREWTSDWYAEDYYSRSPVRDPKGPLSGQARVLRGGSWNFGPDVVRSADRGRGTPMVRNDLFGVRCAQDIQK